MELNELFGNLPRAGTFILLFAVVGLGPLMAITLTSFLKVVVVLKIVRNALGLQDVPPNLAVNALAVVLSIYIMAPVGYAVGDILSRPGVDLTEVGKPETRDALIESVGPVREFLDHHSDLKQKTFFAEAARSMWADERSVEIAEDDLLVLIPSFTTTQLTSAFQVGFLLYLPFVAIDLIVSSVLLALGMIMVSPMTVSLPLKLMLFVLADGWTRLLHGLVLSYQ